MNGDQSSERNTKPAGKAAGGRAKNTAAQAMAAHGALRSGSARRGMLAALRGIRLHIDRLDTLDGMLTIHATRRLEQTTGSLYDFTARGENHLLAEGRIAIAFLTSCDWSVEAHRFKLGRHDIDLVVLY